MRSEVRFFLAPPLRAWSEPCGSRTDDDGVMHSASLARLARFWGRAATEHGGRKTRFGRFVGLRAVVSGPRTVATPRTRRVPGPAGSVHMSWTSAGAQSEPVGSLVVAEVPGMRPLARLLLALCLAPLAVFLLSTAAAAAPTTGDPFGGSTFTDLGMGATND